MKTFILIFAILLACPLQAAERGQTEIEAVALFNGKAMLSVNGKKAKIISAGSSYLGVKLLSSNTDEAVVEVGGRKQVITLDGGAILSHSLGRPPASSPATVAQVWADSTGSFRSSGRINGERVEFVVDTGANLVVISGELADEIDLDYREGDRSVAATAQGTTEIFLTVLDRVSFEGLEFYNVDAGVIPGGFPQTPLLGTSYLNNVDIDQVGSKMTLKKRY